MRLHSFTVFHWHCGVEAIGMCNGLELSTLGGERPKVTSYSRLWRGTESFNFRACTAEQPPD